ncbi:MAG: family 1 glycosylhydrolase, partial [Pseudomonadota bacterium]
NLGIVLNLTSAQPASDTPGDIRAARVLDGVFNRWFLDGVFKGAYPADVLDALGPHMPYGFDNDMASIAAPLDWLGVNYYTRALLAEDPGAPWPAMRDVGGDLPKTQMGWEIYPQGLTEMLNRVHRDYAPGLPIYVTENGMAWEDRVEIGAVHDPERIAYIGEHLNAARAALDAGVNLKGFFYWSLLDNFEWAFGYDKRFGLVHVDFETQARTPKASFHDLARMLASDGP